MRKPRNNTKNKIYHVYNRGFQKCQIFLDHRDYVRFITLLNESLDMFKVEIYKYCILPNHFHLLLQGKEEGDLSRLMHRVCFRYAQYYNARYERMGKVWHDRYKSIEVGEFFYFQKLEDYIEENPVRLNLVKEKELWEYSSASEKENEDLDEENEDSDEENEDSDEENEEEENSEDPEIKLKKRITEIHEVIKQIPYYKRLKSYKIVTRPPPLI